MDSELLELQRLFELAQQSQAKVRLSERNVVELVTKLQDLGLLDSTLLHTVSGKEYLTQDRLRYEMELEIERLGRVSLIELASTIGVDLFYCERQAESIVISHNDLILVQGEIISTGYWDGVAEEINESLQEAGQVSLADIAARLNVGSEVLTTMLEPRMGKLIHGKLEGGQLYTEAYITRISAMIRGAIRALMVPTNLSSVWAVLQQQLSAIDDGIGVVIGEGKLFQTLFNGLLKDGVFAGSLRGGGSIWIPAVFEKAQHEGVETFYSQNSYVTYEMLRRLVISQPKQFLQGKYADGVALDTVFIHSSLINVIDAAVEETVEAGGWIDCISLVPPVFTSSDVAKLLSFCPSIQRAEKESRAMVLAETCVASVAFLKVLLEKLEMEVRELAKSTAVLDSATRLGKISSKGNSHEPDNGISNATVLVDNKEVNYRGNGTQMKSSKRKGSSKFSVNEVTEDFNSGKGSKSKKKGGKGIVGSSEIVSSSKGGKGSIEKQVARGDEVLTEDYIASRLIELVPDLEGAGTGDDGEGLLSKAIASHFRPALISTLEKLKQASFTAAAEERRLHAEKLQKRIDESYAYLQLFTKSLDVFDDDNVSLTALQRHLLRTTASELADAVLITQELEKKFKTGDACADLDNSVIALSTPQRLHLAKSLEGSLSTKCIKMVEALDGKSVTEFDQSLQDVAEECGLRLRQLDKKSEKALLSLYKKGLNTEIEKENDPVALLPKVVAMLFVQVFNKALQAPGRTISAAIKCLKNRIPDEAYSTLLDYHGNTVALLSMLSTSTSGGTDCTSYRVEEKRDQLQSMMPRLKEIVSAPQ